MVCKESSATYPYRFSSIGLALFAASTLFGGLAYGGGALVLSPLSLIIIALLTIAWCWQSKRLNALLDPGAWMAVLGMYLASDFCLRQYSFIQGESRELELLCGFLVCLIIPRRFLRPLIFLSLFLAVAGAALIFLSTCRGRLIFSDDHPTFYYRLWLLRHNFPFIPFFSPLWNAGIDARDFLPTGAHGVFLLYSGVIYLWSLESVYNLIVVGVVFVIAPLLVGLAAWVQTRSYSSSALAALLAAAPSLLWYRWGLAYGTLGFLSAISFAPLVLSIINLALRDGKVSRRAGVTLFFAVSLCVCWPFATIILLPAILFCLAHARVLLRGKVLRLCLLALLLLHLPWMILFARVSAVTKFVAASSVSSIEQQQDGRIVAADRKGFTPIKTLRREFAPINPLIGFCLVPALIAAWRARRCPEVATCLWLLFLGAIVSRWFPQLELERMILVCALVAAPLVATWLLKSIEERSRILVAVPLCVCALIPFTVWRAAANRTPEHYFLRAEYVTELSKVVSEHADSGRVLVMGFTLHELSHGHLAPLPLISSVPFIANSYVHDQWMRADVIPPSFLERGDAGIQDYLRLFNVSLVLVHDRRWSNWVKNQSDEFLSLGEFRPFQLYRYKGFANSYFEQGQGELLSQSDNSISIRTDTTAAVLKFKYFEFLRVSSCTLEPFEAAPELRLISLRDCAPGQIVTIDSIPAWKRML